MNVEQETLPLWERGMNPEQIETIRHTHGPCAVMAVAGAGKTRALVHRMARMVHDGIDPQRILAVTFSKKAADEMNDRLTKLGVTRARVGTWHSLCLQILREDKTPWSSWDVDSKGRFELLVKEAIGFRYMKWEGADLGKICAYIGLCKAHLEMPGSREAMERAQALPMAEGERAHEAYYIAQKLTEQSGLLPFDDFLVNAWKHLCVEENRLKWARRWDFVLQDEAQDQSLAQKTIAEFLAKDHRNYMVIFDPAQSIYKFRGSVPEVTLAFEKEWGAKRVLMNRNYRSGSSIIRVANDIIRSGKLRLPVDMMAERGTKGSVRVEWCDTPEDEAKALVDCVRHWVDADGAQYSDIAVLYRTNAQSRAPEEALLKAKMPYVVAGGASFYERKEIRNLLGYLRVATGKATEDDVRRCINAPFRYLGTAFVDRVLAKAVPIPHPIPWTSLVHEVAQQAGIQRRQQASAADWGRLIESLRSQENHRASSVLRYLVHETRYTEWLTKDEGEENTENSHVANVHELIRIASEFTSIEALLTYVNEMAALSIKNRDAKQKANRVTLMSCHRSKGLEFPHVFLAGVRPGLMPHACGDLEEERRLAYVAVTRARDSLVIGASTDKYGDSSVFLENAGLVPHGSEEVVAS